MKKIKNFENFEIDDNRIDESVFLSIDKWLRDKISNKYLKKIKDEIDSMSNEEKISFINKIIAEKKKQQGRNWLYFIIPIIITSFSFGFIVTSPLLVSHFVIQYINMTKTDVIDEYKHKVHLEEIEDEFEKELDILKK